MQFLMQLTLFIIFFLTGFVFQNCSNHNFINPKSSSNNNLYMNHPNTEPMDKPLSVERPLIDRVTLESVLKNIYLDDNSTDEENLIFNNIFSEEILLLQHAFGHSCDLSEKGTFVECGYSLSNLKNGLNLSSSTIRLASKVKLCQRLSSYPFFKSNFLKKIGALNQYPNSDSIKLSVQMFFPAWDQFEEVQLSLNKLTQEMTMKGESLEAQWQLIINSLCESPYWEIL